MTKEKENAVELTENELDDVAGGFFNTEKGYGVKSTDGDRGDLQPGRDGRILPSESAAGQKDESIIIIGNGTVGKT